MKRVFTITSGKGGVGKTNICVNLAVQLAGKGFRTCIFDADLGLANINILLGIHPEYNLEDVIAGEKSLPEIVIHDPRGIDIIPGASGVEKLTAMPPERLSHLMSDFSFFEGYDILLFDTSAGISHDVISFCMSSKEVVIVITPEPTSLTDGYSLLKVLSQNGYRDSVKVVINQAKSEPVAKMVFDKFNETIQKFLPLNISYMGCLPSDESVANAVARQEPFITLYPASGASEGIVQLADNLIKCADFLSSYYAFTSFWKKYANVTKTPLKLSKKKIKKKENQISCDTPIGKEMPKPTAPPAVDNSVSDRILASLNELVAMTGDIATELKGIRRTLGKPDDNSAVKPVVKLDEQTQQETPIVTLDFEAYVERKKHAKPS